MWIERAALRFGRLDGELAFGAGLNVVHGPNEAGKSTLHEALLRSMFGFEPGERRRADGAAVRDGRAPWGGGPYTSVLVVRGAQGRDLRLAWDFAADRLEVTDVATGEVVLRERPQQRQEFRVGPDLFGMRLADFRQVDCLFQDATGMVERSEELVLSLQRAVENSASDVGVGQADERLAALLGEIGVQARHYGALRGGRLAAATARVRDLEADLRASEELRESLSGEAREAARARRAADDADERLAVAEQTLLRRRVTELRAGTGRLAELRRLIDARPARPAALSGDLRQEVELARRRCAQAEETVRQAEPAAREAQDALAAGREERDRLRREADALASYAAFDASGAARIRHALGRLEALEDGADPEPGPASSSPRAARLRDERDRVHALAAACVRPAWNAPLLAAAVAVGVLSAVLAVLATPAAAGGLLLAAALGWAARPRAGAGQAALAAALEDLGVSDLEDFEEQIRADDERLTRARALHERWADARRRRATERAEVEDELRGLLDAAAVPAGPLSERAAAYEAACAKHARCEQLGGLIAVADGELARAAQPAERLRAARGALEEARGRLAELLERAGITDEDPVVAAAAFDALATRADADRAAGEAADRAAEELARLLDGQDDAALARRAEEAVRQLREHEAAHGARPPAPEDTADLQRVAARERERLLRERERAVQLEAGIAARERGAPEPAVLREELDRERARIARLELLRDAVRIAREGLAQAASQAHRAFAPHLVRALEADLPRVTAGRYGEVSVDEHLAVRVVAPETCESVPVERLSRGTRDQIAMIERIAIARLLDPTRGALPVLLDDPFAHFDPERLAAGARLIADVACERQVVVFTDDPAVVAAFEDADGAATLIELGGPATPLAAGGADAGAGAAS